MTAAALASKMQMLNRGRHFLRMAGGSGDADFQLLKVLHSASTVSEHFGGAQPQTNNSPQSEDKNAD